MYLEVVAAERERACEAERAAGRREGAALERVEKIKERTRLRPKQLERMAAQLELAAKAIERNLPSGGFIQIGEGDKRSALRRAAENVSDVVEELETMASMSRSHH